jgi:hypothetical protein
MRTRVKIVVANTLKYRIIVHNNTINADSLKLPGYLHVEPATIGDQHELRDISRQ